MSEFIERLYKLAEEYEIIIPYLKQLEANKDFETWYNLALLLADKYTEYALKALDEAIAINPNSIEAWNEKANILYNLGRYDEASICYNKAERLKRKQASIKNRPIIYASIGIVSVIAIVILSFYIMYITAYNELQAKDENVKKLAADLDAQYQRRYDLIPNLVEVTKDHMQFEKQVLEELTSLRTQWMESRDREERLEISNKIEEALSKIILTYENYPELKSDRSIIRLMDELAGTKNRITVARVYYNDAVKDYNTFLRTFPNNMFNENGFIGLKAWNAKPYEVYEISEEVRKAPKVELIP